MSAPTSIVVGVAVRVIVNVLCAQNVKVAASVLGLWDGLVFYQAQLDDRFLEPETLLSLAFGLIFDFVFFGSIIRTVTYALWVFLGVLAADFGPDLWYELGGEEIGKDIRREASTLLSALPSWGDESESGSERPVRVSKSPRQASTTASTVRERRVPPPQPSRSSRQDYQSTRGGSRVTFGETATSITQTQSEEDTLDDDDEDETAPTETAGLYMTPSTLGSIHTHAGLPSSTQSLLRRMYDDGHETTTLARSPTHPSESGGTTPRGKNHDLPTFTYEKPPFTPSSFEPSIQMPVPSPIPSPIARVPDVLNSYNNFGHEPDPVSMPEPSISNDEDDSKSDTYDVDEPTVDVRPLDPRAATERISEKWREVRAHGGNRLRVLVPHREEVESDGDHPSFFKFRLLDEMTRQGYSARIETHEPGVVIICPQ